MIRSRLSAIIAIFVTWVLGIVAGVLIAGLSNHERPPGSSGVGSGWLGSSNISDAESQLGITLPFSRIYLSWTQQIRATPGHTTVMSISTIGTSYAAIANGSQDAQIRRQAAGVAAVGRTVYLALQHEPERRSGTPAEYVAAWRRYVAVFNAAHVYNVRWTWIIMSASYGNGKATSYYPGDNTIQVVAADGYNWIGTGQSGNKNRSFAQVFTAFHAFAVAHNKPGIIAEFGMKAGADGGRPVWINNAAATLLSWPDVIAAVWWNMDGFSMGPDTDGPLRALAHGAIG